MKFIITRRDEGVYQAMTWSFLLYISERDYTFVHRKKSNELEFIVPDLKEDEVNDMKRSLFIYGFKVLEIVK